VNKTPLHAAAVKHITPATIYVKPFIPAKAGIQNWTGCRIKSGMTFDMFNCRSNNIIISAVLRLGTAKESYTRVL
jgi:hypothetical protein